MDFEPFGGKMPEDWKVGKLGDIADVIMGQSPSGNSYNEKGIGCIFFQGRAEFGFRFPTIKLFTTEPKRIAKQNDILMSVRAPVGDFNVAYDDCCIGRGLCAIRSKDNFQSFILYTLWSVQNKLDVFNGEGTVFGSINKDSLNNLEIIVPDTRTIQKFENLCSPMDNLIRKNYEENTRLAQLRDILLPKLMSGEIDVSKVNISADKLSFILLFTQSDQPELKVTSQEKSDPIITLVFIGVWDIPDQPEFFCFTRNIARLASPHMVYRQEGPVGTFTP